MTLEDEAPCLWRVNFQPFKGFLQKVCPSIKENDARIIFGAVAKQDSKASLEDLIDFVFLGAQDESARMSVKAVLKKIQEKELMEQVLRDRLDHWSNKVPVPDIYRFRGAMIKKTELRAIKLTQLNSLAQLIEDVVGKVYIEAAFKKDRWQVTWENVNLYNIDDHFVKPLTLDFRCSFVDLVAEGEQPPMWFMSHWWGTPFKQTKALLNFHAAQRGLPQEVTYWVCTFANNQHDLGELAGSIEDTPFYVAILSPGCQGTVVLLDGKVITFSRIWCILEGHVSNTVAKERGKKCLYDLAAWQPGDVWRVDGRLVSAQPTALLDCGDGVHKEVTCKAGGMPPAVATKGAAMDIAKAEASRPEDRRNILHMIAGTPEADWWQEPPEQSAGYYDLNLAVRRPFIAGAMYIASAKSSPEDLSSLLLQHPLEKDWANNEGCTPTFHAAQTGCVECLELLISANADLDKPNNEGATPSCVAAWNGHTEVLRLLHQAMADPDKGKHCGTTPIFMAAEKGHVSAVELLIQARAALNKEAPGRSGATPICLAAQEGRTDALELLLAARADLHKARPDGVTPTILASAFSRTATLELLLQARANVNTPMPDGSTALLAAARMGHLDVCHILVRNGADRSATVRNSRFIGVDGTAAEVAQAFRHESVARFLQN